jgi:glucose-1-phosphate cytidylyltransferase
MKAVILAGGLGTRITEESYLRPKPMIEIGGKPILWHIMKIYSYYGINDFIICAGYKSYIIKEYFANYFLHQSDISFDMSTNQMQIHHNSCEPWKVTIVDTGENTMTGGRLKRVQEHIKNETFCMTYGDGVSQQFVGYRYKLSKRTAMSLVWNKINRTPSTGSTTAFDVKETHLVVGHTF